MTTTQQIKSDTIRIELIRRSMSVADLAARCGLKSRSLSTQLSAPQPSRRCQLLIEAALRIPVWSDVEDFRKHQDLTRRLGVDLRLLSLQQLQMFAAERGIGNMWNIPKQSIIQQITTWLAVKTQPQPANHRRPHADKNRRLRPKV